jgi:hypothetical protein
MAAAHLTKSDDERLGPEWRWLILGEWCGLCKMAGPIMTDC